MAVLDVSTPTTELEAVNTAMVALGQPPLPSSTNLATVNDADVVSVVDLLKKATREHLSEGWRYNSRFGFELTPRGTIRWTDRSGREIDLNTFESPSQFLAWSMTPCPENGNIDMVEEEGMLFDRTHNRPGAEASRYPYLYLDGIVWVNFEDMPESARRYVAIRVARQAVGALVGAPEPVGYTMQDEVNAYRLLRRDQGPRDNWNFLKGSDTAYSWFGRRPYWGTGSQRKVYRGGN